MDPVETAPAQPAEPVETPSPVSATIDAANRDDFSAFQKAGAAKRNGAPLPDVTPTAKPVEHQLSNRQKAVNDAAQRAVEHATTTLREENARLKAQLEGRVAQAPPQQRLAPAPEPANVTEFIRRPDVNKPLLTEAEFFAKFPDAEYGAHARYASNYDRHAEAVESRQRGEAETVQSAQRDQIQGFVSQLHAAKEADPTFIETLSDQVKHDLKPFAALREGETPSAINVIGEQVYASEIAPAMLKYFSTEAGKADLARITAMPETISKQPAALRGPNHINWMIREYGKIEARVQGDSPAAAADAAPAPRTTTALEPPPPTISRARSATNPIQSALARDDFGSFQQAKRAERLAQRNG